MTNHVFRALFEKPYLFLWLGQIFTQIAINLFNFFILLIVFSLTKSNAAVSGAVLSFTIPAIIFGVIAGVYVDRWPKKTVLYAANFIRAFLIIVLSLTQPNIITIYVIAFLVSIATQFFIPAETPMIPLTVPKRHLYSANALFGMGLYGSILAAYIISGPLLLHTGVQVTALFISIMLLIGALFIYIIPLSVRDKDALKKAIVAKKPLDMLSEVRRTLATISQKKSVRNAFIMLSLSQVLIIVISVLAPGYASQVLGIRVEDFPLLFVVPAAVGVVTGAVLLIHFFPKVSKTKVATAGLLLSGLALFIMPNGHAIIGSQLAKHLRILPYILTVNTSYLIITIAFFLGFANSLVFVPSNTTLQEKTTDDLRGKIYGMMNTLIGVFSLLPVLVAGSLSDIFGVGTVITGIGIAILLVGISRIFST